MRIVYYSRVLVGQTGASIHARSLVTALREAGHQVLCVPHEPGDTPEVCAPPQQGMVRWVRARRPRLTVTVNIARAARRGRRTIGLIDAWGPSLVIVRRLPYDYIGDSIVAHARAPVALELNGLHHLESRELEGVSTPGCEARRELRNCERAPLIVAISDSLRSQLASLGVDSDKIDVVPNGVDTTLFDPGVRADDEVSTWAARREAVIGFCGTLAPTHRTDNLLAAMTSIASENPNIGFLFVGPSRSDIEARLGHQLPRGAPILCTGPVAHTSVPSMLVCANLLWAWFANDNASPLKEFEYLATAKPVLIAGGGQSVAVVREAGAGLALENPTPEEFARSALILLNASSKDQEAYATAGRQWVEMNGTWATAASRILDSARRRGLISTS